MMVGARRTDCVQGQGEPCFDLAGSYEGSAPGDCSTALVVSRQSVSASSGGQGLLDSPAHMHAHTHTSHDAAQGSYNVRTRQTVTTQLVVALHATPMFWRTYFKAPLGAMKS